MISMHQLDLFACPAPGRAARAARKRATARLAAIAGVQLCLDFSFTASNDDEGEDDPLITAPIVHRLVNALEAAPIALSGPRSVFDLAGLSLTIAKRRAPERASVLTRVERLDGVVRCVRILPQETQEWQAREAARRARQVTPKPTKKVKTMSKKMSALLEPVSECHAARASLALEKVQSAPPSKREQQQAVREQRQRPGRVRRDKD